MALDIILRHGGTALKDFISSLVEPLQNSSNSLDNFDTEYRKRAKFNGQKIVLQAALNDIFGVVAPPWIIVENNASAGQNTYFYEPSESSPVYFYEPLENDPVYFYEPGELLNPEYDFKVKIPVGIHTAELERRVRAEVNTYKVVGTRFIIETY
jgi:hypothetical protein